MKRLWIIGLVSLLALGVVGFSIAQPYFYRSQRGMAMMGRGYGSCDMRMMGMMRRGWSTNTPMVGMMGRGRGCPMMRNWIDRGSYEATDPLTRTVALTEEQATTMVQDYVQSIGNPNLKMGKVKETDTDFEVEIVTKDDSLVNKILVDKRTGWTRSIY